MEEIQSFWEIPAITHFCHVFRAAFKLFHFQFEELEMAILHKDQEPNSFFSLDLLMARLLQGCFGKRSAEEQIIDSNWEEHLQKLIESNCEKGDKLIWDGQTPFAFLPTQNKVKIIFKLCELRLNADDIPDAIKDLPPESMQAKLVGKDGEKNNYWYFCGVRLYKENTTNKNSVIKITKTPMKKETKENSRVKLLRQKEEKSKSKNNINKAWSIACHTLSDWEDLVKRFSKSKCAVEKQLAEEIESNYLPMLPSIIAEVNRRTRKQLMEFLPKRTSSRVSECLAKKKLEEEERQKKEAAEMEKLRKIQKIRESIKEANDRKKLQEDRERRAKLRLRNLRLTEDSPSPQSNRTSPRSHKQINENKELKELRYGVIQNSQHSLNSESDGESSHMDSEEMSVEMNNVNTRHKANADSCISNKTLSDDRERRLKLRVQNACVTENSASPQRSRTSLRSYNQIKENKELKALRYGVIENSQGSSSSESDSESSHMNSEEMSVEKRNVSARHKANTNSCDSNKTSSNGSKSTVDKTNNVLQPIKNIPNDNEHLLRNQIIKPAQKKTSPRILKVQTQKKFEEEQKVVKEKSEIKNTHIRERHKRVSERNKAISSAKRSNLRQLCHSTKDSVRPQSIRTSPRSQIKLQQNGGNISKNNSTSDQHKKENYNTAETKSRRNGDSRNLQENSSSECEDDSEQDSDEMSVDECDINVENKVKEDNSSNMSCSSDDDSSDSEPERKTFSERKSDTENESRISSVRRMIPSPRNLKTVKPTQSMSKWNVELNTKGRKLHIVNKSYNTSPSETKVFRRNEARCYRNRPYEGYRSTTYKSSNILQPIIIPVKNIHSYSARTTSPSIIRFDFIKKNDCRPSS